MIKRIVLATMIALPALAFGQKFGIVNTQEIVEGMPEMKDVQQKLETVSKEFETEFAALQTEFQKKYEELQKLDETTPATIRDRRIQEIQDLQQKIEQFRTTAQEEIQRKQQEYMTPVQRDVMNAIQKVGEAGNYTMIFENMIPIYTGKDCTNVTEEVKKALTAK